MKMLFRTWLEADMAASTDPEWIGFDEHGGGEEAPMVAYEIDGTRYAAVVLRNLSLSDPVQVLNPQWGNFGPSRPDLREQMQQAFDREFADPWRKVCRTPEFFSFAAMIHRGSSNDPVVRLQHSSVPILADWLDEHDGEPLGSYLRDQYHRQIQGGHYDSSRGAFVMVLLEYTMGERLRTEVPLEDEAPESRRRIKGADVLSRFLGRYLDEEKGIVWDCFTPSVNRMSAWVQLTHPTRRSTHVYDAGGGFRSRVRREWIGEGRPSREEMEAKIVKKTRRRPPKPL